MKKVTEIKCVYAGGLKACNVELCKCVKCRYKEAFQSGVIKTTKKMEDGSFAYQSGFGNGRVSGINEFAKWCSENNIDFSERLRWEEAVSQYNKHKKEN